MLYGFGEDEVHLFQQGSLSEEELREDVLVASRNSSILTSADVEIITSVLMTVPMETLQNETVSVEWSALVTDKL